MIGRRWLVRFAHLPKPLVFTDADYFNIWLRDQAAVAEMFPDHSVEFTVETEEYQVGTEV